MPCCFRVNKLFPPLLHFTRTSWRKLREKRERELTDWESCGRQQLIFLQEIVVSDRNIFKCLTTSTPSTYKKVVAETKGLIIKIELIGWLLTDIPDYLSFFGTKQISKENPQVIFRLVFLNFWRCRTYFLWCILNWLWLDDSLLVYTWQDG